MTKRAAIKRQTRETSREHGVLDSRQFMEDSKVRRLPTHAGWSPYPSNDDRDQAYLKTLKPKSDGQAELMTAIDNHNMVLALGPAGTGKTYLAVAKAVEALEAGKVGRIVLSRPAVEAGESIGFLPGDMEDKLAPYLRPLYDALSDRLSMKRVRALIAEGAIEIAPVGYMRGRTLNNAFVVIDEAQNCTYVQLKMLLTRLGWHSTMVVTGDPNQSDLLPELSGLGPVADRLSMKRVKALMAEGLIEIAPIGYMRGRTLNNAFIVVDEAQNCTYVQLKMLLTRLGWHSTMVVTGDPQQSDLLPGISGLSDIAERLVSVPDISVVKLAEQDIVRHPLVASMIGVL